MNGEGRGRRLDWGRSEGGGRGEGVGGEGGLSRYFNSCLIRVLAAKYLTSHSHSYYPSPASSLKHLPTSICLFKESITFNIFIFAQI